MTPGIRPYARCQPMDRGVISMLLERLCQAGSTHRLYPSTRTDDCVRRARGAQLLTAYLECFLRLNRQHRGLSVDITKMFNDLCRIALMEDLFDMEELTEVDFIDLSTATWHY